MSAKTFLSIGANGGSVPVPVNSSLFPVLSSPLLIYYLFALFLFFPNDLCLTSGFDLSTADTNSKKNLMISPRGASQVRPRVTDHFPEGVLSL